MTIKIQTVQHDLNQSLNTGGDLRTVLTQESDAIDQSIENILSTRIGDRFYNPTFGSNIHEILFEPLNQSTANLLFQEIVRALGLWEPRIEIQTSASIVEVDQEEYAFRIILVYLIVSSNQVKQFERLVPVGDQ